MERKDIVLKNLAEEIKFNRHELLRLNKIDLENYSIKHDKECLLLDFDEIKDLSENLMEILHQEDPINKSTQNTKTPFGTILMIANTKPSILLDLIAKAFKAGNRVLIHSDFNNFKTYKFLNQAWQSVLASQGHDAGHIRFSDSTLDELIIEHKEPKISLCILDNSDLKAQIETIFSCPILILPKNSSELTLDHFVRRKDL